MDEKPKQPASRPPKRDGAPKNNSSLWFALMVVAALALAMFLILGQNRKVLRYGDFERLLQTTEYVSSNSNELVQKKDKDSRIIVKTGPRGKFVEYSEPNDLRIGAKTIEGNVYYRVLASPDSPPNDAERTRVSFVVKKDSSDAAYEELKKMLGAANIRYRFVDPGFWERYGFLLMMTLLMVGLFYWTVKRMGGAGGPMQFGRSRGRLCAEEDLGVTFNDVAGIDEAMEEVKEIVDFLRTPEKYQKLGGKIPCGVLLVGPPGTGKTLLAKAIAGEAGVPFFSLSGSDFVEMFVGVGAARVRDMFQQAQAKAPCIIFIDELDAIGRTRGGNPIGGNDEREQTLNALLVEMDGFTTNGGVIVMGATNRPETLDNALMRPGRFDRTVLVDRPDVKGREEILKVHVKSVKLDPDVDLKHVAAISPGFAGADLANLVNEAALLAARNDQSTVNMSNFNEGVERVTAGLEKKQRVMNPDEKKRVAYHEAGHALIAYSLPNTDPVHKVSIIPRGLAALGYTMQRPTDDRYLMTQSELESQLQILLAGTLAEELIYDDISTGASNDLERATDIARNMVMRYGMSPLGRVNFKEDRTNPFLGGGSAFSPREYSEATAQQIDHEVKRIIDTMMEKVRAALKVRKAALIALTQQLIEVESVDAQHLKEIMDENLPGPTLVPGTTPSSKPSPQDDIPSAQDDSSRLG